MSGISDFAGGAEIRASFGGILDRIRAAETVRTAGLAQLLMWYVLRVPAAKEAAAERILRDKGFNVFVPIEYRPRRRTRYCQERVQVPFPILPGYMLIGFDEDPPWLDVFDHRIVDAVVGDSVGPSRLAVHSVRRLLEMHQGDSFSISRTLRLMRTGREFSIGNTVRVIDHAYDGWSGKVVKLRGAKARVLLEFFNSEQEVEIPLDNLEPDG